MADFFLNNILLVYFFYGLSFFSMGLAVFMEAGHSSRLYFARALLPLSLFGIIHGIHEWLEMFLIISSQSNAAALPIWISVLRISLLAVSFFLLLQFGLLLIAGSSAKHTLQLALGFAALIYVSGLTLLAWRAPDTQTAFVWTDIYTRYSLAIPGAAVTAWGLILQRRQFKGEGMHRFGNDLLVAAIAFAFYGGIGQLFVSPSGIFLLHAINAEAFMRWVGFPIQVFRASMAAVVAIAIIHSLRAFEEENKRRINELSNAQQAEKIRLDYLRNELFHRTIRAQEDERKRIARELHDETGQTLTAIGMGLKGVIDAIERDPERAIRQTMQLLRLTNSGLDELRGIVAGLHPPQLDDLGLVAAIRSLTSEVQTRYNLKVKVINQLNSFDIPTDIRLVLYRIVQEAINNVIRHAHARQVTILLTKTDQQIIINIDDDGEGFDTDLVLRGGPEYQCLGIMGMMERANSVGGKCQVISLPGRGTKVMVEVDLPKESKENERDSSLVSG